MTFVKLNNPATKTFDGFFNEFFNDRPSGKTARQDVFGYPPVNIVENNDGYSLEVSAPGFEKSDLIIKLEDKLLTISADKKDVAVPEGAKIIRKEFGNKAFKRSFTLDDKIDATGINAAYENGILKLTIPKKEVAKNITKEITIQ